MLEIKNDDSRKRGPEIPDTRGTRPERNKDPESHTPIHPVESCFGSDASECPDDRSAARSLGDLVVAPARAVGHLREGEGGGGGVLLPLVQVDGADDGELEHEDE